MKLYLESLKVHVKSQLQYKTSFILSFLSQFVVFFGYYFTIIAMFNSFSNVKGFSLYEVLLTFSIIQFGFSFNECFFRGVDQFDKLIIDGTFDKLLLRPRNILLQVFCEEIQLVKITRVVQSIIILIISLININIEWTILKVITLLLMLFSSIIIFLGIFILSASYCFFSIKGLEVRNLITDGGKTIAKYPIGIFNKGLVFALTFIVPYGFINYYPLLYLVDKTNNSIYSISPLITIIYFIPCIIVFYIGVKRYSSTGS